MPKKPLKRLIKGNPVGSLTVGALEQMIKGYPPYFHPELSESELAHEWKQHKNFIMSLIGQDISEIVPGFAFSGIPVPWGTRAAAWWSYDSPEPRRLLSGNPANVWLESPMHLGKPKLYQSLAAYNSMKYETQPDYLRRLNLLLPAESERIRLGLINR